MPKREDSNRTIEAKLKAIHLRNTRQAKYAKAPIKVSK